MTLYVITGPPAAGKTTWVNQHAKPDDIVIDYDALAMALGGPGTTSHQYPKTLDAVTHRARYAAINEALNHADTTDVYLIHTQPTPKQHARYAEVNATIITIDPGQDIVTQRCTEQRPARLLAAVAKWYATTTTPPAASPNQPASIHTATPPSRRW